MVRSASVPFTPFHLGVGLCGKGLALRGFSWAAFAASNVVIDVESLYHLLRGDERVHVHLHTFVGAALAGLAVTGLVLWARRALKLEARLENRSRTLQAEVSRGGVFAGAMIGALSHPILDGMMHADIQPLQPFSASNPFYRMLDIPQLHTACMIAGVAGVLLIALRRRT